MSEPEPAQGRPAEGAAATETDAPAAETDARLFPDFTQHSFVRAQSNESCEPAPETPARAGRRRGSRGGKNSLTEDILKTNFPWGKDAEEKTRIQGGLQEDNRQHGETQNLHEGFNQTR